ncbi:hypothetical protein BDZ97DRAFT_780378 [Flammula alnicola]|nr:hypothetical protein BDZ97DRAFT_780378 [Flammula alnicola]
MGKFYTEIPSFLFPWIQQQKMFWVATAPLSSDGHVNVSPKGFEGTFNIVNEKKVWYEDMSGSGVETISHVRENGRMTIMFCAFEGPPRIVRLFGTGTVHEFDTPEYNALIPLEKRQPGSRSIIMLDIHKVGSSCGYSIPFYTFKAHRMKLHNMAANKEREDIKAETCSPSNVSSTDTDTSATSSAGGPANALTEPPLPEKGLKHYWKANNVKSIDGLPGLQSAFTSTKTFDENVARRDWGKDDERFATDVKQRRVPGIARWVDMKLLVGFVLGMLVSGLWVNLVGSMGLKVRAW